MDRRTDVKNKAVRLASGGFTVKPQAEEEIGATPIKQRHKDSIDSAFKDAVATPAKVTPGGKDEMVSVPSSVLRALLAEIAPEEDIQAAYQKTFADPDRALMAALQDKADFRRGLDSGDAELSKYPYASLAHLLYPKEKKASR